MELSIIIPLHNGINFIKPCIESILNQTLPQFEIIILENASTDNAIDWLNSLKDPRIKILPSSRFLSIGENWNRIKSVPRKEWMIIVGHDDIMKPNFIQVIDNLIEKHPKASLYQTHFDYINDLGKVTSPCAPMDEVQNLGEYFKGTLSNGGGFVMRSSDYDAVGGVPIYPGFFFSDYALWMKLTSISYKATAKENCFSYRYHNQNTSSISSMTKFNEGLKAFLDYLYELKQDNKEFNTVLNNHGKDLIMLFARSLSNRLLRERLSKRNGLTVKKLVYDLQVYLDKLRDHNRQKISADNSIRMAAFIDSNAVTRNLFLLFKKIYPRPISRV